MSCMSSLKSASMQGIDFSFHSRGVVFFSYPRKHCRLMIMSPLYPLCKPCSTGTHNYDGITVSNLNPVRVFSILQSYRKSYLIYTVTIVICKSRNLIGTLGIAAFALNRARFFKEIS